jgi:hypothetical protein
MRPLADGVRALMDAVLPWRDRLTAAAITPNVDWRTGAQSARHAQSAQHARPAASRPATRAPSRKTAAAVAHARRATRAAAVILANLM